MGSSFLTGTACMGIRIATAPLGPRNDRQCYMGAEILYLPLSLRGAKRRGNPFSLSALPAHTSQSALRLTAPLKGSLGAACCGRISAPAGIKKLHPFGWSSLCWRYLSSRPVTRQVLSAKVCLTSVFGMGTGGPTPQSTPTSFLLSTQLYPEN